MNQPADLEQRVADLIANLPPMPENVDRLLAAARADSQTDAGRHLLRDDPSLCFELMHLASTDCYDGRGPIETIDEAVARVGLEPLAEWVGVRQVQKTVEDHFEKLKDLPAYVTHSQDISSCCRLLAGVTGLDAHRREMFRVAGLIHDIGRLVIMLSADRLGAPLMGTSWDQMATIADDEHELLGMNHCDVGADLCRKWNLSPTLEQGVLRHHTPLVDDDFSYVGAMIFVAHFVSVSDFTGQMLEKMLPPEVLGKLALTPGRFEQAQAACRRA